MGHALLNAADAILCGTGADLHLAAAAASWGRHDGEGWGAVAGQVYSRYAAPSGSRLVLTALSCTSPPRVGSNAGRPLLIDSAAASRHSF